MVAGVETRLRPLGVDRRFEAGATLFKSGEPFQSLFLLRAGTVKRTILHVDGREQVLGFALSGDLLGLASLGSDRYQATATAIEFCVATEIEAGALERAAEADIHLHRFLLAEMGGALRERHSRMVTLGAITAEERVAAFLLDLGQRFRERGFSGERFLLKMTRTEIGALLGLTLETVSRVLSRLRQRGLIRLERREVVLCDLPGLRRLAGGGLASRLN